MNFLCLPILRHAGRLDMFEVEPAREVHKKLPPIPARLNHRALERHELRHRDPELAKLLEAWNHLAHARRDVATLTALLRVMVLAPSSESPGPCYVPRFDRGRDIRPWLTDRAVLRGWLVELSHLWAQAVAPLVREKVLPSWADELAPTQDGAFCPDVHLMARCGERLDLMAGGFDQRFAKHLLPFAALHPLSLLQLRVLETVWLRLSPLLQMDARLCLLVSHGEAGLGWMKLLVDGPLEWVDLVLATILQVGACATGPRLGVRSLLETLRHCPASWKPAHGLRWALQGLMKGTGAHWLAGAYRTATSTNRDLPACPANALSPSANRIAAFMKSWGGAKYLWWNVWSAASRHAGFCSLLSQVSSKRWDEETGLDLIRWLADYQCGHEEKMQGRWELLRAHWQEILQLVWATPKRHREDVIAYLKDGFTTERAEKDHELGRDVLGWVRALHEAWTFDPLLPLGHMGRILLCFNPCQRQRLLAHAAFLITDTRKLNRAYSFESHLRMGMACIPILGREAVLYLLLREPRRLVKGLALLGHLGGEAADRVCEVFAEHPLNTCKPETCSLSELVVMVQANSHGRRHGLCIRKRLSAHLEGTKTLPPHLLAADREELLQAWARLAIEVLEEVVHRELRLMFPVMVSQGAQEEMLMFLHTLNRSQRRGRNLVRLSLNREAVSKLSRPGNKRWMATLEQGVAEAWTQGLVWQREVPEHGMLRLELERDPIEVLRMGDYGNSCLSKGGCFQHSALTNALEANKEVIYARNTSGRVVARQLIAISEQRTLVCFQVYPLAVGNGVESVFIEYDRAFAGLLGLRIEAGDEYTVAAPLGLDWYDDGVWEAVAAGQPTSP